MFNYFDNFDWNMFNYFNNFDWNVFEYCYWNMRFDNKSDFFNTTSTMSSTIITTVRKSMHVYFV